MAVAAGLDNMWSTASMKAFMERWELSEQDALAKKMVPACKTGSSLPGMEAAVQSALAAQSPSTQAPASAVQKQEVASSPEQETASSPGSEKKKKKS